MVSDGCEPRGTLTELLSGHVMGAGRHRADSCVRYRVPSSRVASVPDHARRFPPFCFSVSRSSIDPKETHIDWTITSITPDLIRTSSARGAEIPCARPGRESRESRVVLHVPGPPFSRTWILTRRLRSGDFGQPRLLHRAADGKDGDCRRAGTRPRLRPSSPAHHTIDQPVVPRDWCLKESSISG
jgi:hypothetical protein